jgi:hypothetical protein
MTEEEFSKILDTLKDDLRFYNDMIKEVAVDIVAEAYSKYPVFIATEHDVKMGNLVLDKKDYARDFSIYATTIEELIEHKLLFESRKKEFIEAFKDPRKFMCVLLITSVSASFIFIPYQRKKRGGDGE